MVHLVEGFGKLIQVANLLPHWSLSALNSRCKWRQWRGKQFLSSLKPADQTKGLVQHENFNDRSRVEVPIYSNAATEKDLRTPLS